MKSKVDLEMDVMPGTILLKPLATACLLRLAALPASPKAPETMPNTDSCIAFCLFLSHCSFFSLASSSMSLSCSIKFSMALQGCTAFRSSVVSCRTFSASSLFVSDAGIEFNFRLRNRIFLFNSSSVILSLK
ncbi:hypothetical protein BgiMline_019438 [Biomphalaria glabrata]|nr:hypothetical protein BgiMline_032298 [Biomphalaria glabrata]